MMLASLPIAHTGLALATALSANQNALMLYRQLKKDSLYKLQASEIKTTKRAAIATAAMALVIWFLTPIAEHWSTMQAIERVTDLAGIIAASVATYGITLFATGFRPGDYSV